MNSFGEKRIHQDSFYRRIQRFFALHTLSENDIIPLILKLLSLPWPYFLSMDRTNWKFGKTHINILTVGIVYKGIAFPIAWSILGKAGNSSCEERKRVVRGAIERIGRNRLAWILADREFVWEEWFAWLIEEDIPFWIRVKENFLYEKWKSLALLFKYTEKKAVYKKQPVLLKGNWVYLSAIRNQEELLIVASNRPNTKKENTKDTESNDAIENYTKRWGIEVLFFSIKSWWFHFEDTHMTDSKKISKLFWIVWLALTWCYKVWEQQEVLHPKPLKKHGYKPISTFKLWFRLLTHFFLDPRSRRCDMWIYQFLDCT